MPHCLLVSSVVGTRNVYFDHHLSTLSSLYLFAFSGSKVKSQQVEVAWLASSIEEKNGVRFELKCMSPERLTEQCMDQPRKY
jgi:hypothetical protein